MPLRKYVSIKIPIDIVLGAKIPEKKFESVARVELAIALYAQGYLSLGQARRLAGLSKWDFLEELGKRGVVRHYTEEELEDDIAFAEQWE